MQSLFLPGCNGADGCTFAADNGYECPECTQPCEDGSCTVVGLTSQCTDQCVVVPCSDTHDEAPSCEQLAAPLPCGKQCPTEQCPVEFDCNVFDQFLQCCNDYHFDHPEMRNYAPQAGGEDYSFMTDQTIDFNFAGNLQPQMSQSQDPLAFPSLDSATSTPQLVPSPSFEPSPSPFAQPQSHNAVPSPSIPPLPSPGPHNLQLQCKWSGCFATFGSLSDLVGHVNLQHLRLPAPTAPFASSYTTTLETGSERGTQSQQPGLDSMACLWGDCRIYPNTQSAPGPSSGDPFDLMGMLASHLLRDHLGLSMRALPISGTSHDSGPLYPHCPSDPHTPVLTPSSSSSLSTSNESVTQGGPPTPVPEHDCSNHASHVCLWTRCGKTFAACDALTEHIASTHIGSGRAHYDCFWEGCNRNGDNGFASKQKISRHMQSHTGHRPFQCTLCGQSFSEAATLAQHMRRHTQEKPYACDFPGCGKAFAIAGALTIHKRTHNGSKPFKCAYCDRAFSESSNLSKHLRTHTGARPYSCTEPGCNKSFARPDQLARHANVHKRKAAENGGASAAASD
ncbi:hypothetical protein BD310DRAFT_814300 [Dichomitus squalens]|uniref:C2H2-type domain-containing protein n=1 Tax=Dichomitus squalens TaxID=114155 RepID=A0A4Q9Q1B8_9APHY|nr:hypothetical protein BD310DRAFT_814300 [Dichomitus squalens]